MEGRKKSGIVSEEDEMLARGVLGLFDLFWRYIQEYKMLLMEELACD